jgi:hypothetical protein
MDQKQILKQMISFNKTAFDNTFNALVTLQEQTERMCATLLDQAAWLPEDGKKAIQNWVDTYKSGRDTFRKSVDDSFEKVEAFFGEDK